MYVRKLKRKCSVRGCKCTDTYAISLTREVGNTVIICKSCLGKALGAIDEVNPDTKSNIPVAENNPAPPLFFNAVVLGLNKEAEPTINEESVGPDVTPPVTPSASPEDVTGDNPENTNSIEPENTNPENKTFVCPRCGRGFDSDKGLMGHLRHCKKAQKSE